MSIKNKINKIWQDYWESIPLTNKLKIPNFKKVLRNGAHFSLS